MLMHICPKCKSRITLDDSKAGQTIKCPSCGTSNRVIQKKADDTQNRVPDANVGDDQIKFYCQNCGNKISINKKFAGRKGKCNRCANHIVVPGVQTAIVKTQSVLVAPNKPEDVAPVVVSVSKETERGRQAIGVAQDDEEVVVGTIVDDVPVTGQVLANEAGKNSQARSQNAENKFCGQTWQRLIANKNSWIFMIVIGWFLCMVFSGIGHAVQSLNYEADLAAKAAPSHICPSCHTPVDVESGKPQKSYVCPSCNIKFNPSQASNAARKAYTASHPSAFALLGILPLGLIVLGALVKTAQDREFRRVGGAWALWFASGFGIFGLHHLYCRNLGRAVLYFFTGGLILCGAIKDAFRMNEIVYLSNLSEEDQIAYEKAAEEQRAERRYAEQERQPPRSSGGGLGIAIATGYAAYKADQALDIERKKLDAIKEQTEQLKRINRR